MTLTRPAWHVTEARRAHLQTFRNIQWWVASFALAFGLASLALLVWQPSPASGFVVGVLWASLGWGLSLVILQSSGTTAKLMGATAETWTATELKHLSREGWRAMHNVLLHREDVDHVVIGPGGIFALETKWSSEEWGTDYRRLQQAARQARRNALAVQRRLDPRHVGVRVTPVVVLWGHTADGVPDDIDGVGVVHGTDLASRLQSVADPGLSEEDVTKYTNALTDYATMRIRHENQQHPLNRYEEVGAAGVAADLYRGLFFGLATLVALAFAWRDLSPIGALTASGATVISACVIRNAWHRAYSAAVGVVTAALGLTVMAGAYLAMNRFI
jgi:hypothetical protein